MAAIITFNCLLRQFTSWPVSLVFSFWEIQCVCWRPCHQFVSVAATNLWKAASDQAVWVTDGLWHDEWPQPFPHRPPLHGLCIEESPPLPVHLLAPPGDPMRCLCMADAERWSWLFMGQKSDSPWFVPASLALRFPPQRRQDLLSLHWLREPQHLASKMNS